MFKEDARLDQYIRFAAPQNVINMGREYSNRATIGAKNEEETGVKGGGRTAQAHTLRRCLAVQ